MPQETTTMRYRPSVTSRLPFARTPLASALVVALAHAISLANAPLHAQEVDDPFLWLENVESERALAWVAEHNAASLDELTSHPAYTPIYDDLLEIITSDDRIPFPSIAGERLYNFWSDEEHERGIWRWTSWESYLAGNDVAWETVLDIDALAEAEGVPWAFRGANCLPPEDRICLVNLSRGGSDATEVREFDRESGAFIEDGFFLPEAKSAIAWVDENTLLVGTDFGEGSLTTSGYARVLKRWRRGTPLTEAAPVFEAEPTDMGVYAGTIETSDTTYNVVYHRPSFFEGTVFLVRGDDLVELALPLDATPTVMGDHIVVFLRTPWEVGGQTHPVGSLVAMPFDEFLDGGRDFDVVVESTDRAIVQWATSTRDFLLVSVLDNVRGELWKYRLRDGRWEGEKVPTPDLGNVSVAARSPYDNRFFFTYSSFLQPTTLYLSDADGSVREVRQLPSMFDAGELVTEQSEAVSRDGTRIPYFVVHRADMPLDSANPTLLYAYGGFEISMTPRYNTVTGAAWLERGGVYVVANIRGGGEFGPAWHRAALKENRQRAYDDFIAVSEALISRGITSPEHLGIMGGSNGGLLVGVAFTQRPDLYDAVAVQVPLLDMKRYNKLLAGASWMAEYGNPDVPEEWEYIRKYSPYQNLHPDREYPRVLITTTTRDDRVHPGHARKMAAKMEAQGHPFFYFENTEGGHGSGVTPEQRARMSALTYAYFWKQLSRSPIS
jgi:prolyl oligopeptidase